MNDTISLTDIVGYTGLSKERKKHLWESCVFIFDTNFLLNLYRYESEVVEQFINLWESQKVRCWTTGHVALEFLRNREKVRREQKLLYDKVCGAATKVIDDFVAEANRYNISDRHSFIDTSTFEEKLGKLRDDFEKQVRSWESSDKNASSVDPIYEKVSKLLKAKIFRGFDYSEMDDFSKEADKRFEAKIPPGYEDAAKEESFIYNGVEIPRRFGDLIVWKEILEFAKAHDRDVIFVTD